MATKQSQVKAKRKLLNPLFHLQTKVADDNQLTKGMIKIVRRTGQLNLSGRSLVQVPHGIFTMYERTADDAISLEFDKAVVVDDEADDNNWWTFKPLAYLDLSSNVLRNIPSEIGMFEDLTVLNLQDNNLTVLPSDVGKLKKLTSLNLSHNKINTLPTAFYKLTELKTLSLAYNCLEQVSADMADLVMLQKLDLSYNCLTKLPSGLGFLVRLSELNLSHNKLTELPPDIVNIRGLLKLDLTYNDLISLPKMSELTRLQFLYVQHNNVEALPDFEGCINIQQLYFGNNYIKELPVEFCENMSQLKILDLRDNKIESIPNEIAWLHHLIRLDLTNNDLSTLPNSLGLLGNLQNLQLEGNKLKQIRADIIKSGTIRILKHLREKLDDSEAAAASRNVPTVPPVDANRPCFPDRYTMRNSRSINLTMKNLSTIPDSVFEEAKQAEVTIVDFSKNKFSQVPTGLRLIAGNITELILPHNQITQLPDFIGNCVQLKYLDLANNLLTTLPDSFSSLVYLRELVLSNNRFTQIPQSTYDLVGLEILLLSDNKLSEIDVNGLKKLPRIATLDLSNNNIDRVPPELGNIRQLRSLELKGNCFRQPRYAILDQGTDSLLCYLRDRISK